MVYTIFSIVKFFLGKGEESGLRGVTGELRKEIKKLKAQGHFLEAGDLLAQEGHYELASECYVSAEQFAKAAEVQEQAGNVAQAVAFYKKAGQREKAAEIYAQTNQYEAAGVEMLAAGREEPAAEFFARGGFHRRAAELYEKNGQFLNAAKNYQDVGDLSKQMEMFVKAFEHEYEITRGNLKLMVAAKAMALKAAEYYCNSTEELDRGVELFLKLEEPLQAANSLMSVGRFEEAAKHFKEAGDFQQAAAIYKNLGDEEQAADALAQAALLEGKPDAAAKLLLNSGSYDRAAELYLDLNQPLKAAKAYALKRDYSQAGRMFERAGSLKNAAKAYEAARDYGRAVEIFAQLSDVAGELRASAAMEDFYRVGRLLVKEERIDEALDALTRVEPSDPRFFEACELSGDILWRKHQFDKASSAYKRAFGGAEPGPSNIQLLYKVGRCYESEGRTNEAINAYTQVARVDTSYRDAQARVTRLRASIEGSDKFIEKQQHAAVLKRPTAPRLQAVVKKGRRSSTEIVRPPSGAIQTIASVPSDRYDIVREIARGGMGIVYQARDTMLERTVAFKVLNQQLRNNAQAKKYFVREARAAAKLSHPNIVTVFDVGEYFEAAAQENIPFMTMEFIEGKTLKELVAKDGPLVEKFVLQILAHACRGLQYAHDRGVIHRDIKSGNIMIAKQDRALKILDFGLAKVITEAAQENTQAIGTPFYMSPEQIKGVDLDQRSDIYSLGVTLFELATGTVPFFKGDLAYKHVHSPPPSPRSLNPKISANLEAIILKCMEKSPEERWESCQVILDEMRRSR